MISAATAATAGAVAAAVATAEAAAEVIANAAAEAVTKASGEGQQQSPAPAEKNAPAPPTDQSKPGYNNPPIEAQNKALNEKKAEVEGQQPIDSSKVVNQPFGTNRLKVVSSNKKKFW